MRALGLDGIIWRAKRYHHFLSGGGKAVQPILAAAYLSSKHRQPAHNGRPH
ncbi:MAG TPA: hypothetical protein VEC96_04325 [Anaerolineae bacterium]|nr:hypothetical protein [Anaerolineae bacterium]